MLHLGVPQSFFPKYKVKTMFFYFSTITNRMMTSWLWWSCRFIQYSIINQPRSLLWTGTLMVGHSTWLCCSATSLWHHILSHHLNGDARRKLQQVMSHCSLSSSCNSEMSLMEPSQGWDNHYPQHSEWRRRRSIIVDELPFAVLHKREANAANERW